VAKVITGVSKTMRVMLVLCVIGGAVTGFMVMRGCQDVMQQPDKSGRVPVKIAGQVFHLDAAVDDASRVKGLGGREVIPEDGGMVFMFPSRSVLSFLMRDCPVAIDVAFLDDVGRVLTMHEMPPEEPQREGESAYDYDMRLKKYSSRYPCRLVVEVAGGTLRKLGVKEGDKMELDIEGLKRRLR